MDDPPELVYPLRDALLSLHDADENQIFESHSLGPYKVGLASRFDLLDPIYAPV